ncbi:MAG TPA: VCBS repeat-containing protein [Kofleriaceae bacterium]|nr:VCBS repeat-containing protein [Kofleriaceae bacterium]
MIRFATLVALVTSACTSFDAIDRDVCGNGLIEAGEDCDSSDPNCVRCAVTCDEPADCPNEAYACGVDGMCHAPGGALGAAQPAGPFQVDDIAITDLDKDGIGDVFGVARTSLSVRYGDQGAKLTRSESLVTPSHNGAPAFGDIDDDGALDLVAPTEDGFIAYTSKYGLAPLAVGSPVVDGSMGEVDIRYLFKLGRLALAAVMFDQAGNTYIYTLDFLLGQGGTSVCSGFSKEAFSPAMVDFYKVADNSFVVSMVSTGPQAKLCAVAIHRPLLAWTVSTITPANAVAPSRRPILADLDNDGDRCPDLINTDDGAPALRHWNGSMTANGCALQAVASPMGAPLAPAGPGTGNVAVGHVPVEPAVGAVAPDLLVMSDGLYAYDPSGAGTFGRLYTSQRRLAGADSADLDADGQTDAVLIAATEDDLDVLYRRPNSFFPVLPGYLLSRIDTASRVVDTEIGDFDGNELPDIAYVEQLTAYQRMMAAYSTQDALLPPVAVGAFSSVSSLSSAALPTSEDAGGFTEDVFVVQPPLPGQPIASLTLMSGSALRTMFSYFDPRFAPEMGDQRPSQRDATRLRSTVIGRFAGDALPDTFALAVDAEPADAMAQPPLAWRMTGTPFGPDAAETMGLPTSGFSACGEGESGLCVRDAIYLAWPTSADQDVVIAVDRSDTPHAVTFDPSAATIEATELAAIAGKLPAMSVVRSMTGADLDGDGTRELVIAAAPRPGGAGTSALLVCQMSGATPSACEDLVPAIRMAVSSTDDLAGCVDAAAARVTEAGALAPPPTGSDLIALCRVGTTSVLYRVRGTVDALDVSVLARTSSKLEAIRAGDVTGDGVDDVLAIEGESGAQSLIVFPQCDSRDRATCQRSASAPGGDQ